MASEVFCVSLSGGKEYRARGSHLRPRSTMGICSIMRGDTMESGHNKISEPHHLDLLKMLIASGETDIHEPVSKREPDTKIEAGEGFHNFCNSV